MNSHNICLEQPMTTRRKLNFEEEDTNKLFDNELADKFIENYNGRVINNHTDAPMATQNTSILPPVVTPQKVNPHTKKKVDLKPSNAESSSEKEVFKSPAGSSGDHISGARKKIDFE